ncbi:MAG TPA: hypothetical protein VL547_16930 [Dinghuibacter sp.]|uniref:hypothetical protein n=1 Tax=Dinghuibacter sp. TaxID=2024697 RepID=UPI002D014CA0|nr:hypothetical protein [Dinghuibacter sp.]HTJ13725.1 hypothetical protein [Dinghuibacter sp.]
MKIVLVRNVAKTRSNGPGQMIVSESFGKYGVKGYENPVLRRIFADSFKNAWIDFKPFPTFSVINQREKSIRVL